MNTDQWQSLVRSGLKFLGGVAIAHGWATDTTWATITGAVIAGLGLLFSHIRHKDAPPAPPAPKTPGVLPLLLLVSGLAVFTYGCANQQEAVINAESGVQITVEAAMTAWGDYVKQFTPPVNQRVAVRSAYEKYQVAAVAVIDAEEAIVSLSATNATPGAVTGAQSSLTAAQTKAAQALSDLVALLRSFGLKI